MQNIARVLIIATLTVFLSACFVSDDPLFPVDASIQPVEPGRYFAREIDEDGQYEDEKPWSGRIDYLDGHLHSQTQDMPLQGAVFHPVADQAWIARSATEDDSQIYVLVFTYPDGRIFAHLPECGALAPRDRMELGLDMGEYGRCTVNELATLETAMRRYIAQNRDSMRSGVILIPQE